LQQRGLTIQDSVTAEQFLNNISYFRFAAYLRIFEQPNRTFHAGSTFEQVATLYTFDVELRRLLFAAIQRIEIALRSRVIHQFSLAHGPFWFLDASLAIDKPKFAKNLDMLQRELERSKEEFIKEHTAKYGTTNFPPAWKMLELVSFGCLTKLYMNFADTPAKKRIARSFGVAKYEALESWMRAVNALRNFCAHHARVWNRTMTMIPMLPPVMRNPWVDVADIVQTSPYAIFCCIAYWLRGIDPQTTFVADLKALLGKYPTVSPLAMGFVAGWEQEPLWQ
jgi:abortive infection bacteriophage resistance protein